MPIVVTVETLLLDDTVERDSKDFGPFASTALAEQWVREELEPHFGEPDQTPYGPTHEITVHEYEPMAPTRENLRVEFGIEYDENGKLISV